MQSAGHLALLTDDGHLVVEADVVQYRLQKQTGHTDQVVVLLSLEKRIASRVLTQRHTSRVSTGRRVSYQQSPDTETQVTGQYRPEGILFNRHCHTNDTQLIRYCANRSHLHNIYLRGMTGRS